MIPHALHPDAARSPLAIQPRQARCKLTAAMVSGVAVVLLILAFARPDQPRQLWIAPHSSGELRALPAHPEVLNVVPSDTRLDIRVTESPSPQPQSSHSGEITAAANP